MKLDERQRRMETIFNDDLHLADRKGHDYSGEEDSLANLKVFGFHGIIIRLFDKLYRLKCFDEQGVLEVKDENIKDTLSDIRIYSALAAILLDEEVKNA